MNDTYRQGLRQGAGVEPSHPAVGPPITPPIEDRPIWEPPIGDPRKPPFANPDVPLSRGDLRPKDDRTIPGVPMMGHIGADGRPRERASVTVVARGAAIDAKTLASLLIAKGIITSAELYAAMDANAAPMVGRPADR